MKSVYEIDQELIQAALLALELAFPDTAIVLILGDEKNCVAGTRLEPEFAAVITEGALESFNCQIASDAPKH